MRGGPNRGQGRKPIPENQKRISVSVRLPRELIEKLDNLKQPRTEIIENAIRKLFDRMRDKPRR